MQERQGNERGDGGTAGQEPSGKSQAGKPWALECGTDDALQGGKLHPRGSWVAVWMPPWEPKTEPRREGRGAALSHRPDACQSGFLGAHCPLFAKLRQRSALAMVTAPEGPPVGHLTDNFSLLTLGRRPISLIPILGWETGLAVVTSPVSGQAETRTLTGGVLPAVQVASVARGLAAGPSHLSSLCFQGPIGLDGKPVSRPSWASGSSPSLGPGH